VKPKEESNRNSGANEHNDWTEKIHEDFNSWLDQGEERISAGKEWRKPTEEQDLQRS
jgi:hypothetical protein